MDKLIQQIIDKYFCLHNWYKLEEIKTYENSSSKIPFKIKYIYSCKKCGKIHKEIVNG